MKLIMSKAVNQKSASLTICQKLRKKADREPKFKVGDTVKCISGQDYGISQAKGMQGTVKQANVDVASTNLLMNGEYGKGSLIKFDQPLGKFNNWREKRYYTRPVYVPNRHLKLVKSVQNN